MHIIFVTVYKVYTGAIIGGHKPFNLSCYTDIYVINNTSIYDTDNYKL